MSYYIVNHNVTSDGDHQGITTYDTSVTIKVINDHFAIGANVVYSVQVAAVNVIGQGPVSETTLSEFELLVERNFSIKGAVVCHTYLQLQV